MLKYICKDCGKENPCTVTMPHLHSHRPTGCVIAWKKCNWELVGKNILKN